MLPHLWYCLGDKLATSPPGFDSESNRLNFSEFEVSEKNHQPEPGIHPKTRQCSCSFFIAGSDCGEISFVFKVVVNEPHKIYCLMCFMCVCVPVFLCMRVCVSAYVCLCAFVSICLCVCVFVCSCVPVCVSLCLSMHL